MPAHGAFLRVTVAAGFLLPALSALAAPLPEWAEHSLASPAPDSGGARGAQVLLLDHHVTFAGGRMTSQQRVVLRLLAESGRPYARAFAAYTPGASRLLQLKAWIRTPEGETRAVPEKDAIDIATVADNMEAESRIRTIAPADLRPGSVFIWESIVEYETVITQMEHGFQEELPVAVSRFSTRVPGNWVTDVRWVNHEPTPPVERGEVRQWELRGLAGVAPEVLSPSPRSMVPRLLVTARPLAPGRGSPPAFEDWQSVAKWLDGLTREPATPDETVRALAAQVVAGARTEMDTLRACNRYVQGLRYLHIAMGLESGGGYRPRPAGVVLDRGYGDCKDKANLLRALLAALDRPSWFVLVRSGEQREVAADWPSPLPFNHCILAIALRGSHSLPAEADAPPVGRVLIADPTDPFTPLGQVSEQTEGGLGLLVSSDSRALFQLPEQDPRASSISRRIDLGFDESRGITGRLVERRLGSAAATERGVRLQQGAVANREAIAAWLRSALPTATTSEIEVYDDTLECRYETRLRFALPATGHEDRMVMLRPPLLSRAGMVLPLDGPRRNPVDLAARVLRETLVVRLPGGFLVDEIPDSARWEAPLVRFEARTAEQDGVLIQTRTLEVQRGRVKATDYSDLRTFFARVRAAEEAPIVLMRR